MRGAAALLVGLAAGWGWGWCGGLPAGGGALLLLLLLLCGRRLPRLGGSLPAGGKAVLITGCDKGFGYAAARHLHAQGFTVFAGCLLGDHGGGSPGARELASLESGRLHVLQLDVSSEEEVGRALRRVEETLAEPEQGLWGLVNNAGVASFGDVEFTSMQKYQAVAAVNLWGTIRVTKAFLPLIRRARGHFPELRGCPDSPGLIPKVCFQCGVKKKSLRRESLRRPAGSLFRGEDKWQK